MTKVLICVIKAYQVTISPLLQSVFGGGCRFTPTCSSYTIEALKRFGTLKGLALGIKRFSRCHPAGGSGHDPVPNK